MDIQTMTNDEFQPECPKCGKSNFVAISNGYVKRADLAIGMIICGEENCQTVVGCLPQNEIWEK